MLNYHPPFGMTQISVRGDEYIVHVQMREVDRVSLNASNTVCMYQVFIRFNNVQVLSRRWSGLD